MLSKTVLDLFAQTVDEIDRLEGESEEKHYTVPVQLNGVKYCYYAQTEVGIVLVKESDKLLVSWGDLDDREELFLHLHSNANVEDYELAMLQIARNTIIEVK